MTKGLEATKRLKWGYAITHDERIYLCECIEKELKDYQDNLRVYKELLKTLPNGYTRKDLQ